MQLIRFVHGFAAIMIQGLLGTAMAQFDPVGTEPLPPIDGTLFLHGGGAVDAEMRSLFVSLAGGKQARMVVIPTADTINPLDPKNKELWLDHSPSSVELLQAESRDGIDQASAEKLLASATGVWFEGESPTRWVDLHSGTKVEQMILKLLARGGVVGGTSASAAIASKVMLVEDELREGFDFLPGAIIDHHFAEGERSERLRRAVGNHPDRVGFGIDERTALIVRGRELLVVGESNVYVTLAASSQRPVRTDRLKSGQRADLLAFRRAAQARQAAVFPSTEVLTPHVAEGALLIAGGGNLPGEALEAFIELAGGKQARIFYVPCEEAKVIEQEPGMVRLFRKAGAGQVDWLHTKDRKVADEPSFAAKLDDATGVWFGGGRQWNLVDSYLDTNTHLRMQAVLERGGVVGGSSAGASIQGDYMPRGDPMGNTQMMAEGYERGLGFLTGVAIDQHFSQRNRFADMAQLKKTFPQLLGIGIDEGTCLVVKQSNAEVIGPGQVAFYDRPIGSDAMEMYTSLTQGDVYDLKLRTMKAK